MKRSQGIFARLIAAAIGCVCFFGLAAAVLSSEAMADPTEKPVVQVFPEMKGTPEPGQAVTCTTGTWSQEPTEYGFEWFRDGTPIESEIESEYEVAEADRGHTLGCGVTATNSFGPTTARSAVVNVPLVQRALTVTVSGSGSGLVSSEPGGIFCGVACVDSFDEGTEVALTAAADPGSTFGGWTGACSGSGTCVVSLDSDLDVGASFAATPSGGDSSGGSGSSGGSSPNPSPKPKPLKCRKGFKKQKVHGKQKCVKVHKKKHPRHTKR